MKRPRRCPQCRRTRTIARIVYGEPDLDSWKELRERVEFAGCCLMGDGLDAAWKCEACKHEWGWTQDRSGGCDRKKMGPEALAEALIANPLALQRAMGRRARTAAELAEATGMGLRKTHALLHALRAAGAPLEEGPDPRRRTREGRMPRWYRIRRDP